jgi:NADH-quinone oxidoreductase subunit L
LAWLAVAVSLLGIAAAILVYAKRRVRPVEPELLAEGWYYDQTVSAFVGGPGREAFEATAWFDKHVVDGAVDGEGRLVRAGAGLLRRVQTGNIRNYAGILGAGAVLLLGWFVVVRGVL